MANEDWAKDPNTRPEVLAMLSTSPSEAVRLLVAQNPSTPETALLHLARDEDDQVRKAILNRPQVTSEVLRIAALPRELLAELGVPDPAVPAPSEVSPAPEVAPPVAAVSPLVQQEPAARKSSLFDWFWRLFGRRA